jgi:DNA polymerase-3 subunit epsilon
MMTNLSFIALDFETATASRASACEVGLTFVNKGNVGSSPSYLIQPEDNRYDAANIAVHGITPDMTEFSPRFADLWPAVAHTLKGETVVAHYAPFDMGVIRSECQRCGIPFPEFRFVCSCALARFVLPGLYSYGLEPLCHHFGISAEGHHRAGADALMTAQLILRLCEVAEVSSIDALLEKYRYQYGLFAPDTYKPFLRTRDYSDKTNLDRFCKEYQGDPSGYDEENPFYNKEVVFTGKMFQPRQELMKMVMDVGGRTKDSVTKTTDFLVVGQQDFRVVGADGMSGKQEKAMRLIEQGAPLTILSEYDFLTRLKNR